MSYKLVHEDEHTYRIKHPDGSEFHIAKAHVGPEMHKQIKGLEPIKMNKGGDVPSFDETSSSVPTDESAIEAAGGKVNYPSEYENLLKSYQDKGVGGISGGPETRAEADFQQLDRLRSAAPESLSTSESARLRELEGVAGGQPVFAPAAPAQGAAPVPGAPVIGPQNQPQGPIMPDRAPAQSGAMPYGPTPDDYAGIFAQKASGIKQMSAAEAQEAKDKSAAYENQVQQVQQVQQHYEQQHAQLEAEHKQLFDAAMNQKIDPNRLFSNMGTGNKILAAISVALSGIGSGLTGKDNMAMGVIQKSIDRDIEAQKAELGKKNTLLSENLKRFGDLNTATQQTMLQLNTITQARVAQAAATAGTAKAEAQKQILLSDLNGQAVQIRQQMAMRQAIAGQSQTNPDGLINYLRVYDPQRAKEMEGRYVPGVGIGSVPIPDKARGDITARQALHEQLTNLRDWASKHSGSLSPEDIKYGNALANSVQDAYRRANGQGVFREAEADFVKGIISDNPTGFMNKMRVDPKYRAAIDSNMMELNALKKGYGLPVQEAAPVERRTADGRVALFNPTTKAFVGYKK